MKNKALELRKKTVRMKDEYEFLSMSEREKLKDMDSEYQQLISNLSEKDMNWLDDKFAEWYAKYLEVETKIFIKPCEG